MDESDINIIIGLVLFTVLLGLMTGSIILNWNCYLPFSWGTTVLGVGVYVTAIWLIVKGGLCQE